MFHCLRIILFTECCTICLCFYLQINCSHFTNRYCYYSYINGGSWHQTSWSCGMALKHNPVVTHNPYVKKCFLYAFSLYF